MRYALGLEYDGHGYLGWQTQKQTPTVQDCLEKALSRVADTDVRVVCAGRTDTGVHALGQVVHFDCEARRTARQWVLGGNSNLPGDIGVLWAREVPESFHARFSAFARSYRYTILNRWVRPALDRARVGWCREPLDAEAMDSAARHLLGEHDFSSFRSAGCQARHPVREVSALSVRRNGARIDFEITANGFLYHMVRNIVGSLMAVGRGEHDPNWIAELMAGLDRSKAGVTAPPDGLCLAAVRYPAEFGLPDISEAFPTWQQGT